MTKEEILKAHKRIAPFVHKTPILSSSALNAKMGAQVFFKCENFQKVGAFKARGAMNALLRLVEREPNAKHVATHSSGNHAQALSWGAKQLGLKATIVMPSNAPEVKKRAVLGYGADVIECKPTLDAREQNLQTVVDQKGAFFIPPYDHEDIITGAATAAFECLEDDQEIDAIITPVGGGGLLAGTSLAAKYFGTGAKVYGAEPSLVDDAYQSFKSKPFVPSKNATTIADGLKTSLGAINFPIILENVQDIFTVDENEIIEALLLVYERLKIVIEPSSAVAVAMMLKHGKQFEDKRVVVILSGGNIDLSQLAKWIP